jgi:hypothetical protein
MNLKSPHTKLILLIWFKYGWTYHVQYEFYEREEGGRRQMYPNHLPGKQGRLGRLRSNLGLGF